MNRILFFLFFIQGLSLQIIGQTWSVIGETLGGGSGVYVNDLFVDDGNMYIAGRFWKIGNNDILFIAKWDGNQWSATGDIPLDALGLPLAIAKWDEKIVFGGAFEFVGNHIPGTSKIALWDGTQWLATGMQFEDMNGDVYSLLNFRGDLIISGSFNLLDSQHVDCPVRWDGTSWEEVGGGVLGWGTTPKVMNIYHDNLIVGGDFCYTGNQYSYGIAMWDGQLWHDLDTGLNSQVKALTVDTINDFLYAGGTFTYAGGDGGTPVHFVARWNSESWERVGNDDLEQWSGTFQSGVTCMEMYHKELFIGGGAILDSNIFKLSGNNFVNIPGAQYQTKDLVAYNDNLIVAVSYVNGVNCGLAAYYSPPPTDCLWLHARVFADRYTVALSDSGIVRFRNNNAYAQHWQWDFGDGESDSVQSPIHEYTDTGTYNISVIVEMDGCVDTAYRTIIVRDSITYFGKQNSTVSPFFLGQNMPNPHNGTTTIPYKILSDSKALLKIMTSSGELADEYALNAEQTQITIYTRGFKAGIYFYSLVVDGQVVETKKMVVE
ncbi:MAG: T9SS type A sorting domain-containing protein [Bacteroidetes bacterium]|nr:T9SS type A sorting domain-containing protein [Bacteroidota bacterium]MBU1719146.1 T9SS type A sorting domain-containing protein [Bacteroidota bacterium]